MSLKIGEYIIEHPIVQGGMGVGVSWNNLAGAVSLAGGLGTISSVGTGYYDNCKYAQLKGERPWGSDNAHSKEALI